MEHGAQPVGEEDDGGEVEPPSSANPDIVSITAIPPTEEPREVVEELDDDEDEDEVNDVDEEEEDDDMCEITDGPRSARGSYQKITHAAQYR